jgi:hypothetical protein
MFHFAASDREVSPWERIGRPSKLPSPARQQPMLRRELDVFFSTYPTVAEGFQLKARRSARWATEAAAAGAPSPGSRADAARYRIAPATAILHR